MQRLPFFKMTGSGNDFMVIDNREGLLNADRCQDFVRRACRRKLSAGADGVILIERDPEVDFKWRFFNADGSEAEMCGNGARCAARFAYLTGIVARPSLAFRTLAGVIEAVISGNRVKVQMTRPHSFQTGIRLEVHERSFDLDFINTGVPHVVWFAASARELESADVLKWGQALRLHPHFQPAGANVNFVWPRDERRLTVRTYERGVEGETLACGTGAIAASLVSAAKHGAVSPVEVVTSGGETLTVHFEAAASTPHPGASPFGKVYLEGEARVVYEAQLWEETL
ncbi:MAG: diaminopimelate epimerase [Bryobacterales bacterium]|nr:diaminopimelate epimerase [Bryobacterales bacterium]